MKHVRVRLSAGGQEAAIHPMYGVMANAPFVEYATALQWNFTGDALGIVHYVEGELAAFEAALESIPEVLGYEIARVDDDSWYVYIRDDTTKSQRELFGPVTAGGLVVVPPVVFHEDGTVSMSLFGPTDEIQAAMDAVPEPVDVSVEEVSGLSATPVAADSLLTDRQREAVEAAVELGYYDVPRESTHEAVAAELDCAPSTAAEHLRKAESRLFERLFGR